MSNISYNSTNQNDSLSTGTFLYISESTYEKDWNSFPHKHFFTEIFRINSGSGSFQIEDDIFPVNKGDLIIINPNLQHTEYSSHDEPLDYYVIGIEDVSFVFQNSANGYAVISDNNLSSKVKELMCHMIKEMKSHQIYHINICKSLSDILIYTLLSHDEISQSQSLNQTIIKECLLAKKYIDQKFSSEINLDILADYCHFSKFYLTRKFNEEFGISPMRYLTEKRLQSAEQLLSYTNFTMAQIAESVGYSSQSYFSQVYKKYKRISPVEYRKSKSVV